jgi:triacylglycerol lipase
LLSGGSLVFFGVSFIIESIMVKLFVFSFLLFSSSAFSDLDFFDVKKSALLSSASYQSPDRIKEKLQIVHYSLIKAAELPNSAVSYFYARSPKGVQYLSFRGTANLDNVLVDLDIQLKQDPSLGIQLHQGFSSAAQAAYKDVLFLDKTKPIQTTGHSLGGAVAVIVGMYLQRDGFQLQKIVTFGQPKVTNVGGAEVFEALPLLRVVTPADIVPLVPPLSPLQISSFDIYWHMGKEIILLKDKRYALAEGINSMMRATRFVSSVPGEANVLAHNMSTYLTLIDQKLEGAQQVPYKMKMNVFGFSLP